MKYNQNKTNPSTPLTIEELEDKAREIRRLIIKMIAKAGSGHPGGSLSSTDLITALFFSVLKHDPKNPHWPERDRFHMSKGHCCPLWYAELAESGYFPKDKLMTLRKLGSMLQGHPDRRTPGVESASGSLGQGLSVALGMSLGARIDKKDCRIYVLIGDGEIQEGSIWEAAMAASHYKCDNLCAIMDCNGFQIDGATKDIMNLEPVAKKWQAFGWHTIEIDGHNMRQILSAYDEAKTIKGKPSIIIARTIKGKGVSFMENVVDFHGRAPTQEEAEKALRELE
ncbi:MAG: transketolase [Candidatus Omnitrophica bacterium CG08_land_8_20_14_0_20_41_16]|uniref:Transketolase n=1 Tax=Candidatus Sherwoodlollariibacterium unditelluris TaxID=1974757 RepID=A0A2G9YIN2_9BACT|nr:MAG: transketolase [Candidatus Omnitrophica bacterium CG23_combo_of_CG06-09_8_20_14_all_41_10]PIS33642.1 MAG: transketolase [Candidatus Omnitrophica bacterium CG08_land_8_20_14_0_20_41_16]